MEKRKLGNTEIMVTSICLGTMNMGEQNDQRESFEQMDYAVEQGINFFDTAELYPIPPKAETYTRTESIIGQWFKERKSRNSIILATKIAGPQSAQPWVREGRNQFDEPNITAALEGSLRRLATDYIDLYQLHWPNRKTNFFGKLGYQHREDPTQIPIQETLKVLGKFLQQGKIRHYGLSNETPWGIMNCLRWAERLGLPAPVSVQNPYNLLNRSFEVGCAEVAIREQTGLLAYSPLAFGVLSGKYLNGQKPAGSRLDKYGGHYKRYNSNPSTSATARYVKIAHKYGLSPAQMALSFVNSRPFVTSNIIGARTMDQLRENIGSIKVPLSPETLEDLEKVHQEIPNPAP